MLHTFSRTDDYSSHHTILAPTPSSHLCYISERSFCVLLNPLQYFLLLHFQSYSCWTRRPSYSIMFQSSFDQETKRSTENITRIVETVGSAPQPGKYKSTQSLHELGLDNYPNPDMPESSRLTRKEEKQSLQNLNNRLAGTNIYIRSM